MADNPNAFKLWFDEALVRRIASKFTNAQPSFDEARFVRESLDGLDELELKDRVRHIATVLHTHLGPDFPAAIQRILDVLPPGKANSEEVTEGFELWPYCQYVETYGLEHLDVSLDAMLELTQRFSAEFAIRPFLQRYPTEVLARLLAWTTHPNVHVRRWVSEGTRPRLPWGIRLQAFVDDPQPVVALLEALRHDPEEYVRRSVANNLNDIAKDHPALVVAIAQRWWPDSNEDERRMIKHALRGLVKAGDAAALELLGFAAPELQVLAFDIVNADIKLGEKLEFELTMTSTAAETQNVLLDYAIHHAKANGARRPKVFKWTTCVIEPGATLKLTRKHHIRPVTTRRYYAGEHEVEVFANGESIARQPFRLTMEEEPR